VRVRGSYTKSYIGCVSGTDPLLGDVVMERLDAADKRAATLSGHVLLSSER
jgi:hypothetical protein